MALRFNNVSFAYDSTPVLSGLELSVNAGEILCLLGPSGCGKSTLLRLAAGLERLQTGTIELDSRLLASPTVNPPPEQRPVGLMFQENALFPHMTVAENIQFGLRQQAAQLLQRRTRELLALVGLEDLAERYPHQLSGGQQQRIALVRAIAPGPQVLLMDEPYASIDITLRRPLREAARQMLKRNGTTTIMVTHDPIEAMEMADTIAVLDDGKIIQSDTPLRIYDQPVTSVVAAFFGDAQTFEAAFDGAAFTCPYGTIRVNDGQHAWQAMRYRCIARPNGLKVERLAETVQDNAGNELPPLLRVVDIRYSGDVWVVYLALDADGAERGVIPPLRVFVSDELNVSLNDPVRLSVGGAGFFAFPLD